MKISVIGLGKLGLPFAFFLASHGNKIFCYDTNKEILRGKAEVVETTYLLAAILNFIIENKPAQISIGVFENNDANHL